MFQLFHWYQYYILLVFLFAACNKDFKLPPQQQERLFLLATLHPDSVIQVRLTHTLAPLEPKPAVADDAIAAAAVGNATIIIYENDMPYDTLEDQNKGIYRSKQLRIPSVGKSYFFKVFATGYDPLTTIADSIPNPPPVKKITATLIPTSNPETRKFDILVDFSTPVFDDYIGAKLYYYSTFILNIGYQNRCLWDNAIICDQSSGYISLDGFCLSDFYCVNYTDKFSISIPLWTDFDGLLQYPSRFSVAIFSEQSIRTAIQVGLANEAYGDNFEVNPFYSPIFLPFEVEGGYAAVYYYNTHSETLKF
jgi:hypothetical protein